MAECAGRSAKRHEAANQRRKSESAQFMMAAKRESPQSKRAGQGPTPLLCWANAGSARRRIDLAPCCVRGRRSRLSALGLLRLLGHVTSSSVDRLIKHPKPVFESPRDHLFRIHESPSGCKKFCEKQLIFHVLNEHSYECSFINALLAPFASACADR